MKAIHKERLLQVVRVLEELPKEKKFDLGTWYECGTVGCACGWAGQDPWFRRRGFRSEKRHRGDIFFQGIRGYKAAQIFFGILNDDTFHLFSRSEYKRGSKRDVINRIKKFVANG